MANPPPLPKPRNTGCGSIFGIVAALVLGIMIGRLSKNDVAPAAPPPPQAFAAFPPAPKAPEVAPIPSSTIPLPKGMSGSAKLSTDGNTIVGKVVGITDGDSLTLLSPANEQIKIRLEGIDAPEGTQEYGAKAKQALSTLIFGKTVTANITDKDRYDRSLAWIEVDGVSINRRMVGDGWAWQYLQYNTDPDIARLQETAKAAGTGLWAATNTPMAPWEFRALGRTQPSTSSPSTTFSSPRVVEPSPKAESETGKYWINSNGVRHNARCRWYGNTKRGHYSNSAEGRGCGICGG